MSNLFNYSSSRMPEVAGQTKIKKANTATGSKMGKSIKIIFITNKIKNKKYLGLVSSVYNTEQNQRKMGRVFIPYPKNPDELFDWEKKGYVFPDEIKNLFF